MIKIVVLVDDKSKKGFSNEHGFSILISYNNENILFDTGQQSSLKINSNLLDINMKDIDRVIISHGHYDHTGALDFVLNNNDKIKIFAHPDIFLKRFSIYDDGQIKDISMPERVRKVLDLHKDNIIFTKNIYKIDDNFYISGEIPRVTNYEDVGGPFFLDSEGNKKDALLDDQAVWLDTKEGLVIITGCCHAGIVNTIEYIFKISNKKKILALLGGFHLKNVSIDRLEKTVDFLNSIEIDSIIPCHCTGENAIEFLKKRLNTNIVECVAGSVFKI